MKDVVRVDTRTGEIAQFEPQTTRRKDAQADAVIEYAKRLKDWPLLEQAVELKIEEQGEFVEWWHKEVSIYHGAGRGKKSAGRGAFSMEKAEELTGITHQQVSRWVKALKDKPAYSAKLFGAAWKKAMGESENHRSNVSAANPGGENGWSTPGEYIELARSALGAIDLDPATSEFAQETVRAASYFTPKEDGLSREWGGRVWMNPPYAQPLIAQFIEKLIAECAATRIEQAIVLTHNSTDTAWFHRLESIATRLCFTRGRIAFVDPCGNRASPPQGQVFFYIGNDAAKFESVFATVGFIR